MKNAYIQILKRYLPVILWMIIIFLLSSQSSLPGPKTLWFDFVFKKMAHIFVYAVLYFLMFRAVNGNKKTYWILPFILSICYAFTDEIHQSFIPNRTARIRDVGYDGLGMFIAYMWMKRYI